MRLDQLAHVVGAAANVTGEREFVVIGSQAILGTDPDAPATLLVSMEVDIYPRARPELADEIDGALGDGSQFHRTFGYYAHAVGPETAKAPEGWERRLVRVSVDPRPGSARSAVACCLEAHDLVLAKCAAGRDRDWEFALSALHAGLVDGDELLTRIDAMALDQSRRAHVRAMVTGLLARAAPTG
jgi:AcrR family transcriptional regulator